MDSTAPRAYLGGSQTDTRYSNGSFGEGLSERVGNGVRTCGRVYNSGYGSGQGGHIMLKVRVTAIRGNNWLTSNVGIWITPSSTASPAGPSISLFGSTNLNARSANLDTELSFVLLTRSREVQTRLGEEVMLLREDAREEGGLGAGGISWVTRIIVWCVAGML